ncbi:Methyl-CpG-binding domain-containing protein 7 [Quillaja saponaria]|uniref:Methyl-CpG-binding domain-containing protein 7 n=1 Tax=Quillaja saponaria TaxID=32244 RepID=A0AAD7KZ93_QUISA|nr:Methyl-CpG-binding domain-containing protein 7 [Quillaja saponaria]
MKGKLSPSTPMPIPLQMRVPGEEEEPSNRGRELQMVTSSSFTLPDGWYVEEKPRPSDPGHVDKYYYEPGTGKKFRSLVSVQRYLTEDRTSSPTGGTLKSADECNMQIVTQKTGSASSFKLPNDWVVEERPRSNIKYGKVIDKYYTEPETGVRFRSLKAVERYLTEVERYLNEGNAYADSAKPSPQSGLAKKNVSGVKHSLKAVRKYPTVAEEDKVKLKAMKLAIHSTPSKKSGSRKKIDSGEDRRTSLLNFSSPPAKINWVLSGSGGNMWSAFMGESTVPDSVKQKWSEKFRLALHERDINAPRCQGHGSLGFCY